jgi:hypothetical protein
MGKEKYSYDRFGTKGSRVGQAVTDILSVDQPAYTAEEILEQMGEGVVKYLLEAAETGCKAYSKPFYILHIFKKELGQMGAENVMLQKATIFENRKWTPKEVMDAHPTPTKTLYECDPKNGTLTLLWTVPSLQECQSILRHPGGYDPHLCEWAAQCTGQEALRAN